jgi:hypothetical protein
MSGQLKSPVNMMFFLLETRFSDSSEIFPNNYTAYRIDNGTLGEGVFVLVHNDIIAVENPELVTNCELEWVKIQLKDMKELLILLVG